MGGEGGGTVGEVAYEIYRKVGELSLDAPEPRMLLLGGATP